MCSLGWIRVVVITVALARAAAAGSGVWLDVPFIRQPHNGCGAACLAMVITYWREQGFPCLARTVNDIQEALYSRDARGTFAADLQRYLEAAGFRAFAFRGTTGDLRDHLGRGRPLIVALGESHRKIHYVVVVGLDEADGTLLVNDPAQRKLLKMDQPDFQKRWDATRNWTLLAVPASSESRSQ